MDKVARLAQKAADHAKSCEKCSKSHTCDIAAQIGMDLLIATISQ